MIDQPNFNTPVVEGPTFTSYWQRWLAQLSPQWQKYMPSVTGTGGLTISGLSVQNAWFCRTQAGVQFHAAVNFTTGGTAANLINVSLPVTAAQYPQPVSVLNNTNPQGMLGNYTNGDLLTVDYVNGSSWPVGTPQSLIINGIYRTTK